MPQQILIAAGAGLAAALLFFIPVKGTPMAMTLALFAALPLMIAGLAFSPAAAFVGALVGALALLSGLLAFTEVSFAGAFAFSAFFALTAALPAWQLTRLAWLGRPPEPGERPASDGMVWYPLGGLVAWMAGLATAVTLAGLALAILRWGSFEGFLSESARRLTPIVDAIFDRRNLPYEVSSDELARMFVMATPPAMAGWTVAGMALNLWLGGRIAAASQRLRRPWAPVPENFELPGWIPGVFGAGLALALVEGLPRVVGLTLVAAFGAALALRGLAAIHAATRGTSGRTAILAAVYMTNLLLFPLPLPLFSALGLAAMVARRRRTAGAPPSNPT